MGPAKWLDPAPASYRSFSVTELVVSELTVDAGAGTGTGSSPLTTKVKHSLNKLLIRVKEYFFGIEHRNIGIELCMQN